MNKPSGKSPSERALAVARMTMSCRTLVRFSEEVPEGLLSFPFPKAVVKHTVVDLRSGRGENLTVGERAMLRG